MSHDGADFTVATVNTSNFDFTGIIDNIRFRDGVVLRLYDSVDTDHIIFTHTGTIGQIFTNSGGGNLHIGSNGTAQILGINTQGYIWTEGSLFIRERANAFGDTAAYGQHWVKTETPNVAYFTDDAGGDWPVAGNGIAGNGIVKYKTADTSRNTTITLADDPHLAGWSLEADTVYMIEAGLWFQSASSTPDIAWTFQFSNTPQASKIVYENTAGDDITATRSKALTGGSQHGYNLIAFVHSNATTGGTMDWQWAQLTSDATDVTVELGSWMKVTKLGTA